MANARKVRLIDGSTRKNDRPDADKLARLTRYDTRLLAPIEHRTAKAQAHLACIRLYYPQPLTVLHVPNGKFDRDLREEPKMVQQVTPFLMFESGAREAAEFYVSIFPDGKLLQGDWPGVAFELGGQRFNAFDGGPHFSFTEAVSFMVTCDNQEQVDHYWKRLLEGGGEESMCGWLKDRFGVSWQINPTALAKLIADPDPERAERARQAMFKMRKIDIAALEAAADGE